jgi:hypothetical protein
VQTFSASSRTVEQADFGARFEAAAFSRSDEASASVPIPMGKTTFVSFETHFPILLAKDLLASDRGEDLRQNFSTVGGPAPVSAREPVATQAVTPIKILSFELEPASLGTLTVRVKISRTHVDLSIGADSDDALTLLNSSRGKLIGAIRATGAELESLTIQATQISPPAAQQANESRAHPDERSSSGGGNNGASRDQGGNHRDAPARERPGWSHSDVDRPNGVARNSGLYL